MIEIACQVHVARLRTTHSSVVLIQLATTAVRQGLVAGANALGGHEKYLGSTGVCTTELFGIEVASVGITTRFASDMGISPISARVSAPMRPTYFPSRKSCIVKLLSNRQDERLIGAQIIGEDGVSERANLAAHAIHMKQDVNEFAKIETCYAPPVAPVWDRSLLQLKPSRESLKLSSINDWKDWF